MLKEVKFSFCLMLLLLFVIIPSKAQIAKDTGKIEIVSDKAINDLLETHIELNSKSTLKGYRIKIHFSTDKMKAKEVKAKFISKYPKVPAYEKYDQPNFNIRVGDFRTKLEAYKFLKEIQTDFPTSFLVQDEIELPALEID
jgi:hypothetical protein